MSKRLKIIGIEPSIQSVLCLLLAKEPGLLLVQNESAEVDIVLFKPANRESVEKLRSEFPAARLVALADVYRSGALAGAPVDDVIDPLVGYQELLACILN